MTNGRLKGWRHICVRRVVRTLPAVLGLPVGSLLMLPLRCSVTRLPRRQRRHVSMLAVLLLSRCVIGGRLLIRGRGIGRGL